MCDRSHLKREERVQSDLERIDSCLKDQLDKERDDESRRALLHAIEILKRINSATEAV
jgi:hypothetical protein